MPVSFHWFKCMLLVKCEKCNYQNIDAYTDASLNSAYLYRKCIRYQTYHIFASTGMWIMRYARFNMHRYAVLRQSWLEGCLQVNPNRPIWPGSHLWIWIANGITSRIVCSALHAWQPTASRNLGAVILSQLATDVWDKQCDTFRSDFSFIPKLSSIWEGSFQETARDLLERPS